MRAIRFAWALILLGACELADEMPVLDPPPEFIGPVAAEPAWNDLVQHTTLVSPDLAFQPDASFDGKLLAYATTEFGRSTQIVVHPTGGAAPTQITDSFGDNHYPNFSRDGKLIAWASNREGDWDLYTARLDAPRSVSQVTFGPEEDIAPSWSPDGESLVYCSREKGKSWRIVIVNAATRVKTYLGRGIHPDWSPDPDLPLICFESVPHDAGDYSEVWVIRPDGTGLRRIAGGKQVGWGAAQPRFSPDGRWIAYTTIRRSPESRAVGEPGEADDIWVIRPDGSLDTRLTDDLSAETWPAWGGERIFFVSTREGTSNVYSVVPKPLEEGP